MRNLHDNYIYHPCPYYAYNPICNPNFTRQVQPQIPNANTQMQTQPTTPNTNTQMQTQPTIPNANTQIPAPPAPPIPNANTQMQTQPTVPNANIQTQAPDNGPNPFVIDIEDATEDNNMFRTTLWTGEHFQLTLMSIEPGDDIGLELHEDHDQFIRIEDGQGLVQMGDSQDNLDFQRRLKDDYAVIIPAGKWHNIINTGNKPLKLYSIYAPPEHPSGTVHATKAIAEAAGD